LANGIVLTGSYINGAGQGGVYLQGVNAPIWVGVDVRGWGLETANNDAIFSTGQVGTGGIGQPCPFTPLGGQWIGGVLNNTGNATKFGIEETSFGPNCYQEGGAIQLGNSYIEISATHSVISNNTIDGGGISLDNDSYRVTDDVQLTGNNIKAGYSPNPTALVIGGVNSGATSNITVTGGDIDVSGWTGGACYGILLGNYGGLQSQVSNVKIEGVNIHQDSGISLPITSWVISGDVVIFQGSFTGLAAGTVVNLSGFGTSTFFNGNSIAVSSTGLSSTQFEAPFTHANGSGTETGLGTGALNGCHGIYSAALDGSATLQIRHSTFTNLLGAFGDQPEPTIGMTDIDLQDNTLRGNTPVYDNFAPVAAVN